MNGPHAPRTVSPARVPASRRAIVATVSALVIGGAVFAASSPRRSPAPDASPRVSAIRLTSAQQASRSHAERAALTAGAVTVGVSRDGDVVALFPAGEPLPAVPGIPGPGIRAVTTAFTHDEYREVTHAVNRLARRRNIDGPRPTVTADYSYVIGYDVDTGQVRLTTAAPVSHIMRLRREFPDILVVTPGAVQAGSQQQGEIAGA